MIYPILLEYYNIYNVYCTCYSQLTMYLVRNTLHRYISKQVNRAPKPLPTPYQEIQAQTHPYSAPRPLQCFEQRHTRPRCMARKERKSSSPDPPIQSNCKPHMGNERVNSPMLTAAPPFRSICFDTLPAHRNVNFFLRQTCRPRLVPIPPRFRRGFIVCAMGLRSGLGWGRRKGWEKQGGCGMLEGVNRARVWGMEVNALR